MPPPSHLIIPLYHIHILVLFTEKTLDKFSKYYVLAILLAMSLRGIYNRHNGAKSWASTVYQQLRPCEKRWDTSHLP